MEEEIQELTVEGTQEKLAETEQRKRVEIEAEIAEIKRKEGQLPPGWKWVWMEDPQTRVWERLRVPKEEVDYRRRDIPPRPSYWGEDDAREWRRKLREEKERVERERRERLEWRVNEMRRSDTGGPWATPVLTGHAGWSEVQDDDTIPLLEGEVGQAVKLGVMTDWPGPWNTAEGNSFLTEGWNPLANPLSTGEKLWDNFVDTGYLLNAPINLTPVSKLNNSHDLFGRKKESKDEPSHLVTKWAG